MTTSIRTFLLINLLLSVTLITSLAIIGNLFLEHKDLQSHLDAKLTQSAFTIQAFMSHPLTPSELQKTQMEINAIPNLQSNFFYNKRMKTLGAEYEKIQFQVWDKNGNLLLHSPGIPSVSLVNASAGFTDTSLNGKQWRIFTTIDPINHSKIVVAEQYDFRNLLEGRITQDSIFIMLMTYPFLGLLIWIIVGRGLSSLQRVATEVHQRVPSYLEPFDLKNVPIEIKPLIDELNKLFSRLHAAFEREKRFAADAAHELKTPLAALKAHTQVALNATTDIEREEALRKLLAGVDRSSHVIQQLLILSRMVPEAGLDQTGGVNITRQAKEVIAELVPEALKKDTEIELIAPSDPEPTLPGNATALGILIRNLVDNAIRYTPAHSLVQVVISEDDDHIFLKVIDNGPGIPENLRARVFERFFRVLGSKSTGSGLGLGIVQQIAELHKAHISLDTPESGKGLQVTVTFPKH